MILTLLLAAQLRSVDLSFAGIECASCVESMPARIQRLRGVESAKVDADKQILSVKLAAGNRVRLEQIRDAVEQDGTKTRQATVTVQGTISVEGGRWLIKLPNGSQFEIVVLNGGPRTGRGTVSGTIQNLRVMSIAAGTVKID